MSFIYKLTPPFFLAAFGWNPLFWWLARSIISCWLQCTALPRQWEGSTLICSNKMCFMLFQQKTLPHKLTQLSTKQGSLWYLCFSREWSDGERESFDKVHLKCVLLWIWLQCGICKIPQTFESKYKEIPLYLSWLNLELPHRWAKYLSVLSKQTSYVCSPSILNCSLLFFTMSPLGFNRLYPDKMNIQTPLRMSLYNSTMLAG